MQYILIDDQNLQLQKVRHGYGRFVFIDPSGAESISIMEGQWSFGKLDGYGRWLNGKGNCYVGTFDENQRSGKGVYFWHSGDVYEGSWAKNKLHGKGTFYYAKTGETFVGEWYHGNIINNNDKFHIID